MKLSKEDKAKIDAELIKLEITGIVLAVIATNQYT